MSNNKRRTYELMGIGEQANTMIIQDRLSTNRGTEEKSYADGGRDEEKTGNYFLLPVAVLE